MRMLAFAAIATVIVSTGSHAQSASIIATDATSMSTPASGETSGLSRRATSIAFLVHQQPFRNAYPVTAVPFPAFADAKAARGLDGDNNDKAQVVVPLLVHAPIATGGYPLVTVPSVTMK